MLSIGSVWKPKGVDLFELGLHSTLEVVLKPVEVANPEVTTQGFLFSGSRIFEIVGVFLGLFFWF